MTGATCHMSAELGERILSPQGQRAQRTPAGISSEGVVRIVSTLNIACIRRALCQKDLAAACRFVRKIWVAMGGDNKPSLHVCLGKSFSASLSAPGQRQLLHYQELTHPSFKIIPLYQINSIFPILVGAMALESRIIHMYACVLTLLGRR